jgi:hypothetical protein
MKKIVDLSITVDGLILAENESVEQYIEKIKGITNSNYEILYEINYEEEIE